MPLDHEQHDQDRHGQRHNYIVQLWGGDFEPFHRGQHRDGRRDHAVAVEQGGREDAQHADQRHDPGPPFRGAAQQGQQGQAATLTFIVGAHDDDDVLDRHDAHHRPEDQRQHAQHMQLIESQRVGAGEGLLHRVKRAGADVAEHDADSAENQTTKG